MAPDPISGRDEIAGTRVLPFRGEEGRAPSPVLVRQCLFGAELAGESVRSGVAVVSAIAEAEGGGAGVPEGAAGLAQLVERTALTPVEAGGGLACLRQVGAISVREGSLRLDPDLYCTLPALAALDWSGCRREIQKIGGRLAPALAVVRELARMSRIAADGGGEWLHPPVQDLVEETLYARTAVTRALGELVRAGLLVRTEQPARRGLRIRLAPRALGIGGATPGRGEAAVVRGGATPVRPASSVADGGVTLEIGGASIGVPAGARLQLPSGMNYRLEIGPAGEAIVRIDD